MSTRFRIPMHKNNCSHTFYKSYNNDIYTSSNPSPMTSSLNVIPYQQTLNMNPVGKPGQSRRGRKPLKNMPVHKKHAQNLVNQRAFRQRKEKFVQDLERKATHYEMLYNSSQDQIKELRSKVELLEKKLNSLRSDSNNSRFGGGGILDSAIYQSIVEDNHPMSGTSMNNHFASQNDRGLSSFASVPFNEQEMQRSLSMNTTGNSITTSEWMTSVSNPSTTSPLYSTFAASNISSQNPQSEHDAQWQFQQDHSYFNQTRTTINKTTGSSFTQHHPLNLKWILSQSEDANSA